MARLVPVAGRKAGDSEFLTVEEVAEFLRVPVKTVRYLMECGRLPYHSITRVEKRIRRSDLEQFLAKCRSGNPKRA